jgi:CRP-like cAMP-binding protein
LSLLRHLDFSEAMTIAEAQDFVASIKEMVFRKGDVIIRRGAPGDRFYMIYSGNVSIIGDDPRYTKLLGAHDYFGEAALIRDEKRSADAVAQTDVVLYSIEKECFLSLIEGTEYATILSRLASVRDREAWEILSASPFVRLFTSTQRTWLESIISPTEANGPGNQINEGARLKQIYIIRRGAVDVLRSSRKVSQLGPGDLVGHVADIFEDNPSRFAFHHDRAIALYAIRKHDFNRFLRMNPGLIKKLEYGYAR